MPDGIASLYPQPVNPASANVLLNPKDALATVAGAVQLNAINREVQAKQAIGQAYQGALGPDGSVDMGKLSSALAGNPAAAYGMQAATTEMLNQQRAQLDLNARQNQFIWDAVGSVANDPTLDRDKVRNMAVSLARNLKIPGQFVNSWLDNLPASKPALRNQLIQFRNLATGSANLSTPTPTGLDTEGAPITAPRDVYNIRTATAGGGMPSQLGPGEDLLRRSPAERAAALQATASTSPQYRADLQNLAAMSKTLDIGGPTVKYEKALGQIAQRFGLPSTLTPDQLASAEEFDKLTNTIALNQGKALGGTDAARVLSVGATPSTSMSRYGREGVIGLLQGNQDFIDHAREQWLAARSAGAPASQHDQFMQSFGKNYDVRVFQFARLNRDAQQKFINSLSPAEIPGFEQAYQNAEAHGWVPALTRAK